MIEWVDTLDCPDTFHRFHKDENGKMQIYHGDDTVCPLAEFKHTAEGEY